MLTFILFAALVAVYVAFLLWCFAPIISKQRRRGIACLSVPLGLVLLGANLIPLLAWPILLPLAIIDSMSTQRLYGITLFPWTLPRYISNIYRYKNATATVIDVKYPIEISGVRSEPLVRTACTTRRGISLEKGVAIRPFEKGTTASGGELLARAGDAILAINHSYSICLNARRMQFQPDAFSIREGGRPAIFVVRGKANQTKLYSLYHDFGPFKSSVDDISLYPPEIVNVSQKPAREMISLDDLWPMSRPGDHPLSPPEMIKAYKRLPATENACVLHVTLYPRVGRKEPWVYRTYKTDLSEIPVERRSNFCRNVLERRIPSPPMTSLNPVTR